MDTDEQRLDVIANCEILLNTILKPFEQTDATPEGRMIAQLKWLKERAQNHDLALPVHRENVVDLAARRRTRGQAEARPLVIEVSPGRRVTFTMKDGTSYTFHGDGRVYAGERYLCSARNAPGEPLRTEINTRNPDAPPS